MSGGGQMAPSTPGRGAAGGGGGRPVEASVEGIYFQFKVFLAININISKGDPISVRILGGPSAYNLLCLLREYFYRPNIAPTQKYVRTVDDGGGFHQAQVSIPF